MSSGANLYEATIVLLVLLPGILLLLLAWELRGDSRPPQSDPEPQPERSGPIPPWRR